MSRFSDRILPLQIVVLAEVLLRRPIVFGGFDPSATETPSIRGVVIPLIRGVVTGVVR